MYESCFVQHHCNKHPTPYLVELAVFQVEDVGCFQPKIVGWHLLVPGQGNSMPLDIPAQQPPQPTASTSAATSTHRKRVYTPPTWSS